MKRFPFLALAAAYIFAAPTLAHDFTAGDISIVHPWIAEPPPGAPAAAGYGVIANDGDRDDRLLEVRSAVAARTELHEMRVNDEGVMQMRHVEGGLAIAAHDAVVLEPGGYHVMFMHLGENLAIDALVPVTLVFEHAGEVEVEFMVQPRGAADTGHDGMDMDGHGDMEMETGQ